MFYIFFSFQLYLLVKLRLCTLSVESKRNNKKTKKKKKKKHCGLFSWGQLEWVPKIRLHKNTLKANETAFAAIKKKSTVTPLSRVSVPDTLNNP